MVRTLILIVLSASLSPAQTQKYNGPRPPKPDVVYLLHASTLVETETTEAKAEKKKNDTLYVVQGTSSPAKTPLAEPIFILESKTLSPERIQLYRLEVKNGHREIMVSGRRGGSGRPLHLSMKRLGDGLFRLEANEFLPNGEYALSPEGSDNVFLFSVY